METTIKCSLFSFLIVFTGFSSSRAASGDCVKVSNCKCQYQDDQSVIDLGSIGKRNDFAFPYQKSQETLSSYEYAYNPCYPVTDTDKCKDVAACQKDTNDHFPIGDASSADFQRAEGFGDVITLRYTSIDHIGNNKIVIVKLLCDQTAKTPQLEIISESPTSTYNMELTSECCCPDGCADRPPPPDPGTSGGLSVGSIICIAFTVLVVVYLVAGLAFMTLVKKSRGTEAIPNYSFWRSLPGLTKDGFKFTYSKIKGLGGSRSAYADL